MDLTATLDEQLHHLITVFLAENENINLSSLRTPEAAWNGHVLDALAFLEAFQTLPKGPIIDIGTGGGFPMLPLALAVPSETFTGLDATQKKIAAVGRMVEEMGLTNVHLLAGRAEELGHDPHYREKYGVATSRAVASLPTLIEYCSPFVRRGGYAVFWKSLHIQEELTASANAQNQCRLKLERSFTYTLPEPLGERQLLIFRKAAPLPRLYPRAVGLPGKTPL